MANTAWSTTDKTAGVTLSGSNLTVSTTGATNGIRAVDRQLTGKFYWEVTFTSTSTTYGTGLANANATLANLYNTPFDAVIVYSSGGSIWLSNVSTGLSVGALNTGGVILCLALDLTNGLFWARKGAAGNWNGNASANPATGAAGLSIATIGGGIAAFYPAAASSSTTALTANFGDTAFSGTVPVGFTSGFPTGTPTLIAANTQIVVEEWGASNPDARATQLLVEEWTVVPPFGDMRATQVGAEQWAIAIPPPMQATQVAIEQWTSTATATTQMLLTQAAMEQWSPVTSAVAAVTRQAALTVVT